MASKQSYIGRVVSQLTTWLGVPRVITLPVLVLFSGGCGELLWHFVTSAKVLSWVAGMATPFCMMCATVVWAMRDRLSDAFDTDQMSSKEYQKLAEMVSEHRTRSSYWAAFAGLMALVSSIPTVSNQLIGPVWHWMVIGTSVSVAGAIYAYLLANHWEQQIRAQRTKQKLESKRAIERNELLLGLASSNPVGDGMGWIDGPDLIDPIKLHH
jgi:hypothetical protein